MKYLYVIFTYIIGTFTRNRMPCVDVLYIPLSASICYIEKEEKCMYGKIFFHSEVDNRARGLFFAFVKNVARALRSVVRDERVFFFFLTNVHFLNLPFVPYTPFDGSFYYKWTNERIRSFFTPRGNSIKTDRYCLRKQGRKSGTRVRYCGSKGSCRTPSLVHVIGSRNFTLSSSL